MTVSDMREHEKRCEKNKEEVLKISAKELVQRALPYIRSEAKRLGAPEWAVLGHIFGFGSGYAAALLQVYDDKTNGGESESN